MGRPKGGLNNKWTYDDCIKVVTRHVDEHIRAATTSGKWNALWNAIKHKWIKKKVSVIKNDTKKYL